MAKNISRRHMLGLTAAAVGGVAALAGGAQATSTGQCQALSTDGWIADAQQHRPYWAPTYSGGPVHVTPLPPGRPGKDYKPVVVPTGYTLPFNIVDGVKVFHLIAEEVEHDFDAGLRAHCWAYNGHVNSALIEAVEGEQVRHLRHEPLALWPPRSTGTGSIFPTAWTAWAA